MTTKPTELDTQELREGMCQLCNSEYPVWFAPNDLWNELGDVWHFLCPTCFMKKMEQLGYVPTSWHVTTEAHDVALIAQREQAAFKQGFYAGQGNAGIESIEECHKNWDRFNNPATKPEKGCEFGCKGYAPGHTHPEQVMTEKELNGESTARYNVYKLGKEYREPKPEKEG